MQINLKILKLNNYKVNLKSQFVAYALYSDFKPNSYFLSP